MPRAHLRRRKVTANETPMKGGEEATLVQPEGVPTANRAAVNGYAESCVGRASGALLTGPTAQAGWRQTPQGESNVCQGQPILIPALRAAPAWGVHGSPVGPALTFGNET